MIPSVLARALAAFLGSTAILLYYEVFSHRHLQGRQIPLLQGFFVLLVLIINRAGAFILGAAGALLLYPAPEKWGRGVAVAGGLAGLWLSAIFLQIAQNGVRKAIGAKTYPVRWIRSLKPRRKE